MSRRHILPFARPEETFTVERTLYVPVESMFSAIENGLAMEIQLVTYESGLRRVRAIYCEPRPLGETATLPPGPADVLPLRRLAVAGR